MTNETESEKIVRKLGKLEKITVYSISSDDDEPYEPGRYKICTGYLGNLYVIDTKDPVYILGRGLIAALFLSIAIPFLIVLFVFLLDLIFG